MRRYVHETVVQISPAKLFEAIVDIRNWPVWDSGIESTEHDGRLEPGARFSLKPKGGPTVSMSVETAEAPSRFVDVCHLPLAKMRTVHEFLEARDGSLVRVTIEGFGPLGFLWNRLVARKQACDSAAQVRALAHYAGAA
jgi:uncharacterized protein YndB with AHSA1/START domain